jgi:hypothetical protein
VSPVRYKPGFYIPEDDILPSQCRENLSSYISCISQNKALNFQFTKNMNSFSKERKTGVVFAGFHRLRKY